jgi:GAF domain
MLGSDELSARLAAASKMLADAPPGEPVVVTIGRALLFLTETEHAAIFFRSPNGFVTCPWSHNLSDVYIQDIVTPKNANPWVHILRNPELSCMDLPKTKRQKSSAPWFLPDALALSSDHAHLVDRITREGLRSMCAWPLTQGGRVTGAFVYYYDSPHVYSQDEQEVMSAFGSQAAAALRDSGAPLSQTQSTMNARDTTRTPTDSWAAFGLKTDGSAPKQPILGATRPPLADTRRATEDEQARVEIEAARAQLSEAQRRLEAEEARRMADRSAAFAAERAQITETLEAKTVQLARDREEPTAGRLQLVDVWARADAAEVARGRDTESLAVEEARIGAARQELETTQAPAPRTGAHEAGPSRWRQAILVASAVIAAVAIAVLKIGPGPHRPAVRMMEQKPAAQASATAVQKRPVPTPHQATAARVVPSVVKAGVPHTTSRALRPRKATYVVVVGTFESANTADGVKRLVQSEGYVVHVVRQGRVSRVMTAPMRTRRQAEGVARGLEAVGLHPQVVVSYEQSHSSTAK